MTERVLCIDPGTEKSGWVLLEDGVPVRWDWEENFYVLTTCVEGSMGEDRQLVIEDISHYGFAVGMDVFETLKWMGRFDQADGRNAVFIPRHDVLINLCGKRKGANDSTVRQALIDRYGGDAVAIGGKKCRTCKGKGWVGRGRPPCKDCVPKIPTFPETVRLSYIDHGDGTGHTVGTGYETPKGPLFGISGHVWSALACGVTFIDQEKARVDSTS